jgi:hypothetical protein
MLGDVDDALAFEVQTALGAAQAIEELFAGTGCHGVSSAIDSI